MFGVRARRSRAPGLPGTWVLLHLEAPRTPGLPLGQPHTLPGPGGIRPLRAPPSPPDLRPKLHLGNLEGAGGLRHARGAWLVCLGGPGPWLLLDPCQGRPLVPSRASV